MPEPIIQCFKEEFDRFYGMLEAQVTMCPDELWVQKRGGFFFWQQIFHTFACIELYALPLGAPSAQNWYSLEVAMLSQDADTHLEKEKIMPFARTMKTLAHTFIHGMTASRLTQRHPRTSQALGKELTNQSALIGLVRHTCYHLGCCDAILRQEGLPGVY